MQQRASTNRACQECKRKKTRCDGRKPECSLCMRVRSTCVYPPRKSRLNSHSRWRSDVASDASNTTPPEQQDIRENTYASAENEIPLSNTVPSLQPVTSTHLITEQPNLDFENLSWRDLIDTYYYPFDPMNATTTNLGNQLSPIDQDMMDYLNETVPNIWIPETSQALDELNPMGQLDTPPDSATMGQASEGTVVVSDGSKLPSEPFVDDAPPSATTGLVLDTQPDIEPSSENTPLDIPTYVIDDLIDIYFHRIQIFLPLFHRPTFPSTHLSPTSPSTHNYSKLSPSSLFILYGMLALSARFSTLSYFTSTSPRDRGTPYALAAQSLYHNSMLTPSHKKSKPSLHWLQGSILLAYYNQVSKPSLECDLLISGCIRTAYDLGLHKIDESEQFTGLSSHDTSTVASEKDEDWVSKEEKRRAWWAVWELDAFDSISSRHPFSIDRSRILVFLPVSDSAWFSSTPVQSAMLKGDLLSSWKVLVDSPNQDERAWFLVSNYITVQALELCQQRFVVKKGLDDIETVVSCFAHVFHERFWGGGKETGVLEEGVVERSNWLILTRLMIQSARIITSILNRRLPSTPALTVPNTFFNIAKTHQRAIPSSTDPASPPTSSFHPTPNPTSAYQPASECLSIYQSWPPEHISFVPPTMVSMITGPAAMVLRCARHMRGVETGKPSIQEDLMVLILSHFARFWDIGRLLLDFVRAFR